jgi:hypothetical protein
MRMKQTLMPQKSQTIFQFVARYRKTHRIIATAPRLDQLYRKLERRHVVHDQRVIVSFDPPKGAICVYCHSTKT